MTKLVSSQRVRDQDTIKLKYFLGIEITHSKQGIFISHQKYVPNLLKETDKTGYKPTSTQWTQIQKLGKAEDDAEIDKEMYNI